MGENIDEFLSIHQHFHDQNLSSAICLLDHFFAQGVIEICAHVKVFPVQIYIIGRAVVYSYARQLLAKGSVTNSNLVQLPWNLTGILESHLESWNLT